MAILDVTLAASSSTSVAVPGQPTVARAISSTVNDAVAGVGAGVVTVQKGAEIALADVLSMGDDLLATVVRVADEAVGFVFGQTTTWTATVEKWADPSGVSAVSVADAMFAEVMANVDFTGASCVAFTVVQNAYWMVLPAQLTQPVVVPFWQPRTRFNFWRRF